MFSGMVMFWNAMSLGARDELLPLFLIQLSLEKRNTKLFERLRKKRK